MGSRVKFMSIRVSPNTGASARFGSDPVGEGGNEPKSMSLRCPVSLEAFLESICSSEDELSSSPDEYPQRSSLISPASVEPVEDERLAFCERRLERPDLIDSEGLREFPSSPDIDVRLPLNMFVKLSNMECQA